MDQRRGYKMSPQLLTIRFPVAPSVDNLETQIDAIERELSILENIKSHTYCKYDFGDIQEACIGLIEKREELQAELKKLRQPYRPLSAYMPIGKDHAQKAIHQLKPEVQEGEDLDLVKFSDAQLQYERQRRERDLMEVDLEMMAREYEETGEQFFLPKERMNK
jgi:hypothetical protein